MSGQGGQSGQQSSQSGQMPQSQQSSIEQQSSGSTSFQASDKELCTDMLMTEKYVSGAYDTAIFEFKDAQVRDVLNHIQKEEQKHGEAIFTYMQNKGMYSPS
jgi:spore coat protein CotF